MIKQIYINASQVSHLTKFNRFTKENEDLYILLEHNEWLKKYVNLTTVDPIDDIIDDLDASSELIELLNISDKNSIKDKLYDKIKESIYSNDEDSKIFSNSIKNIKLKNIVEEIIQTKRGSVYESTDISEMKQEIRLDNTLIKKELFRFDHKDFTYKIIIGGRVDGYVDSETILETKHRRNRLFKFIPNYEKVQIEMYLYILNLKKCLHVENYKGEKIETEYFHNEEFLENIKQELKDYLISFIEKYITITERLSPLTEKLSPLNTEI